MSSIEERLARDIAAVTGDVIVTESNLRDARNALDERIESKRRRDRRRTVGIAAAAAVVAVVVGVALFQMVGDEETAPAPPVAPVPSGDPDASYLTGSAPTPQLLAGVWRVDNGGTLLKFEEDGTVVFDYYGTLFSDPVTTGTYEIDGDLISVTTTADAEADCIGESNAFRASIPEPGAVRFVRTEEASVASCTRMPPGRGALEQLLPTGPAMMGLDNSTVRGWEPLTGQGPLHGFFMAEGGGFALEMGRGGAYFVADESGEPIDHGQWSLRGSALTLTSSAQSTECAAGDQLVLRGVEEANPGTTILRGTVAQNACGAAWTPATWVLIPNETG